MAATLAPPGEYSGSICAAAVAAMPAVAVKGRFVIGHGSDVRIGQTIPLALFFSVRSAKNDRSDQPAVRSFSIRLI